MNKDFVYKKRDAGNKELFSMLIYRPIAKIMVLKIFKFIDISPNIISLVSLVWVVIAGIFFAFYNYPLIIAGAVLIQLSYLFDVIDGQYARYKGMSTKFGQWFDPFLDTIKVTFLYMALSYRAYNDTGSHFAFIWGFIALTNSFLTFYILNTRGHIIKGATFEIKPAKNIYVGYEISLYWAISFFVVINKVYAGLIFLAIPGALSWIKCFITLRRYYFKNKEKIENEP